MTRRKIAAAAFVVLPLLLVGSLAGTASAKAVYLFSDHNVGHFDAYDLDPVTDMIAFGARYNLDASCLLYSDPAGVDIWEQRDVGGNVVEAYIFVSAEFDNRIEVIDALSFTYVTCCSTPAPEIAGLAMDRANSVLYGVQRESNALYAFYWDNVAQTLTEIAVPDFPVGTVGMGLAIDYHAGILYVADAANGRVLGYDVNTWAQVFNWSPAAGPVGVAVDPYRKILYTTYPDGTCAGGTPGGSLYICRYDLTAGTETYHDLATHGSMGVAVNWNSGVIYVTGGCSGDNVTVWDTSTSPWTNIQTTGDIGRPAGIVISNSFPPFDPGVALGSSVPDTGCVNVGDEVDLTVHYWYSDVDTTGLPVTGVFVEVTLDPMVDHVSSTGGGVYDVVTHSVTWDVGTMYPDDDLYQTVVVDVGGATYPYIFRCLVELRYNEGEPKGDGTGFPLCEPPPWVTHLDIKPGSCPNPLNIRNNGVLPVAILGTDTFDVTEVDPSTVLLEGVPPLWWSYADVTTPVGAGADTCECNEEGPDGYLDMTLQFRSQAIVAELGDVTDHEVRMLTLTGTSLAVGDFAVRDCVWILDKRKLPLRGAVSPPAPEKGITEVSLSGGYPNPFTSETRISFVLPEPTHVSLVIYSISGKKVRTLVDRETAGGAHSMYWDGNDEAGARVASGVYFCRLIAEGFEKAAKLVLVE